MTAERQTHGGGGWAVQIDGKGSAGKEKRLPETERARRRRKKKKEWNRKCSILRTVRDNSKKLLL